MSIIATYIVPHPPLIIPEVGKGKEKRIQHTIDAYHQIAKEIGELQPETILIVTPHATMYTDYIHLSPGNRASGNLRAFGEDTVSINIKYDTELVSMIEELAGEKGIPAGTLGEKQKAIDHGALVPLYFIEQYYTSYQAVRISISGLTALEHYRFGECLKEAVTRLKRRTVLIASGDLSHRLKEEGPYSFAEEGPAFDQQVTTAMKHGDFLSFLEFEEGFCEAAGECGLRSFQVMAGALDGQAVETNLLSYEGPFGVGYAVCSYHVTGEVENRNFGELYQQEHDLKLALTKSQEDEYVRLARLSLETFLKEKKELKHPDQLSTELTEQRAGVFVSLKKQGRLRGCIGTITATEHSIAEEIMKNAISAGVGDPRFDPLSLEELPELVYSVDVLGKSKRIESIEELDVKRYGVIVSKGRKRGLLLPNLEGVTNPEQQVEIALKKAGIQPEDSYQMERFEVVRHI